MIYYAIVASALSCALVATFLMSGDNDKGLLRSYIPSVHFQLDKKDGNFISISDLLKNRNKLLNAIINEAKKVKYKRINSKSSLN